MGLCCLRGKKMIMVRLCDESFDYEKEDVWWWICGDFGLVIVKVYYK
jgi:hypothetical protein